MAEGHAHHMKMHKHHMEKAAHHKGMAEKAKKGGHEPKGKKEAATKKKRHEKE